MEIVEKGKLSAMTSGTNGKVETTVSGSVVQQVVVGQVEIVDKEPVETMEIVEWYSGASR